LVVVVRPLAVPTMTLTSAPDNGGGGSAIRLLGGASPRTIPSTMIPDTGVAEPGDGPHPTAT